MSSPTRALRDWWTRGAFARGSLAEVLLHGGSTQKFEDEEEADVERPPEQAGETFGSQGFSFRELWTFMGAAWMVSIAYLDPGNLETDLQAGAQFDYKLAWVLLWSSILGFLIQVLSLRLGIVSRCHLALMCREEYPSLLNKLLWVLAELMIVASDVPEIIGTAFAIQILSSGAIPLWAGVLLCALSTLLFLSLSYFGLSALNSFIGLLVGVMSTCFIAECVIAPPSAAAVAGGTLIPTLPDGAIPLAVGLLGAVAMPHNLFLQSALVLSRKVRPERRSVEYACLYMTIETASSLFISFVVNGSVLLVAAASFAPHWCGPKQMVCQGGVDVCDASGPDADCFSVGLETASTLLQRTVGAKASTLWAIALLASGQSSTITGTFAGQFVIEGFLELSLPLWLRNIVSRAVAIVPSLAVALIAGPQGANQLVVASTVVLSLHLPLALVPLLKFTDSPLKMGNQRNSPLFSATSWFLAFVVVGANACVVWDAAVGPLLRQPTFPVLSLLLCALACACYIALLTYLIHLPVRRRVPLPACLLDDASRDPALLHVAETPAGGEEMGEDLAGTDRDQREGGPSRL